MLVSDKYLQGHTSVTYILTLNATEDKDLEHAKDSADDVFVCDIKGRVPTISEDFALCHCI